MKSLRRCFQCLLVVTMVGVGGCDPVVTIAGANFPDWMICAVIGSVLAAGCHPFLQVAGLERHLHPLPAFYGSLMIMFSTLMWIALFSRV